MIRVGINEERLLRDLAQQISNIYESIGLFYRLFYRVKAEESIERKIQEKEELYVQHNKKLQDFFGLRLTLYFADDYDLAVQILNAKFRELPGSHSIDEVKSDRFGPVRYNLVFALPIDIVNNSSVFKSDMIDGTFEIQIRTMFSEGWHEVEHDLRYKCKEDWVNENDLARVLNSQLAVLESCDWTMLKIFDELSYNKYKNNEWSSFFRNIMRIRFVDQNFSNHINSYLDSNKWIAKKLLKINRNEIIMSLFELVLKLPLTMDNVFFIVNRVVIKDIGLIELESPILKRILTESNPAFSST